MDPALALSVALAWSSPRGVPCEPLDVPAAVQSFPPDGSQDVPTDVQRLRLFVGCGWSARVELDGQPLTTKETTQTGWVSVQLPPLTADTLFSYSVTTFVAGEDLEGPEVGPFTFETGSTTSLPIDPSQTESLQLYGDDPTHCELDGPPPPDACLTTYESRHMLPDDALHLVARLQSQPGVQLWQLSGADIPVDYVEADCPARLVFPTPPDACQSDYCISVAAIGNDGLAGPSDLFCAHLDEDSPLPDPAIGASGPDFDGPHGGNCRVSAGSESPLWLMLLCMSRRRRR